MISNTFRAIEKSIITIVERFTDGSNSFNPNKEVVEAIILENYPCVIVDGHYKGKDKESGEYYGKKTITIPDCPSTVWYNQIATVIDGTFGFRGTICAVEKLYPTNITLIDVSIVETFNTKTM